MAVLKYYDGSDWEPVASALVGPTGATGATGPTGPNPGLTQVIASSVTPAGAGSSGSVDSTGTVTFSTCTTIDLNGVFTSTYDNYKIIYTATGVGGDLGMRFGIGGSFNSTSGNYRYNGQYAVYTSGTITGFASSTTATGFIVGNTGFNSIIDIYSPYIAKNTAYTFQHNRDDYGYMTGGGAMTVTTSYDQVRFYPTGGGTIAGTIRVYGYNQ